MRVTLEQIMSDPLYMEMSFDELMLVVNEELYYKDYINLKGSSLYEKTETVYKLLRRTGQLELDL